MSIYQIRRSYLAPTAFSANTFSPNVLQCFTAIHSLFIVNTNNFFTYFYQRKQISRKWHRIYSDQTNSLGVIRIGVLGLNVLALNALVLNSCARRAQQAQSLISQHLLTIIHYSCIHTFDVIKVGSNFSIYAPCNFISYLLNYQ